MAERSLLVDIAIAGIPDELTPSIEGKRKAWEGATYVLVRMLRAVGDYAPNRLTYTFDYGDDENYEITVSRVGGVSQLAALEQAKADLAEAERIHKEDAAQLASAHDYVARVIAENAQLLRWMCVAPDAHLDHLCAIVQSLAASAEGPASLRALSADGVVAELRRAFDAERIARAQSEAEVRRLRRAVDDMEARALDAEMCLAGSPVRP